MTGYPDLVGAMISQSGQQMIPSDEAEEGLVIGEWPRAMKFDGKPNQRAKKDVLWKPLLCAFRTYVRQKMRKQLDVSQIYDGSGGISMKAKESCKRFIKSVGGPEELQNDIMCHYGLIVTVVHCSYDNLNKFFVCVPELQRELNTLKPVFSKIFRENSLALRKRFFENELIRYLWSKFAEDEMQSIRAYIRRLKSL